VRAALTGSTILALNAAQVGGGTDVVEWQVVEYDAASVQNGTVTFAYNETSKSATLSSPVVTPKSWLLYTYSCGPSGGCLSNDNNGSKLVRGLITNGTTLTFDRSNPSPISTDVVTLNWQLVSSSDATYVQSGNRTLAAGGATTADVALSKSVSPAASIATAGGYTRGGRSTLDTFGLPIEGWFTLQLNKPKSLRIVRGNNAFAADVGSFVVTFPRYEIYGAPALGALGPNGCPSGTYRSTTNLIPNGAFATSGGAAAAQPLAASQFTVDPRQTAPAWGWAGDNARPNDTQFSMTSGVWCYSFTPLLTCEAADVTRQGAFPGDPGFGMQPTACALAPNPSTPAYNADYPGCWIYGNGNSYAMDYKIWETRGTVGLTASKTYTFVAYASDVIKPGYGASPPQMIVRKSTSPCTNVAGTTVATVCGGTAPVDLNPTAFAVPQVGLYTCDATTEVKLTSFSAVRGDASLTLEWRTGSELKTPSSTSSRSRESRSRSRAPGCSGGRSRLSATRTRWTSPSWLACWRAGERRSTDHAPGQGVSACSCRTRTASPSRAGRSRRRRARRSSSRPEAPSRTFPC
jgi:hypothetical protein